MASPAEQLPEELWAQILQHVPNKQRLSACALVCQKLARAAAAATRSVYVYCYHSQRRIALQRHDAFLSWVSSHGSSLTYLKLSSSSSHSSIRQLPCPNLLELHVDGCSVQLCAGGSDLGLLHSCTALTRLVMRSPTLLDGGVPVPAGGLSSAAAQLQHLTLAFGLPAAPDGEGKLVQALQDRLLPHLTALTCLDLRTSADSNGQLASCCNQHISTMAGLKQLHLSSAGSITAATLPGIERRTALEDLSLVYCKLEPSCLLPMVTGLTRLCLEGSSLRPKHAQQDGALGASHLLQLLARLTALRELTLGEASDDWPQQLSLYSALTASSNLQVLSVCNCGIPSAAWAHVFPAGRKLPHLHEFAALRDEDILEPEAPFPFNSTAIARFVSCAPALGKLQIGTCEDASLEPLKSLTALTQLDVAPMTTHASICSDLATLTQLSSTRTRLLGCTA